MTWFIYSGWAKIAFYALCGLGLLAIGTLDAKYI